MRRHLAWTTCAALALLMWTTAAADDSKTLEDGRYVPKKIEKSKLQNLGWAGGLDVGASLAFSQNKNVVGSTDGYAFGLGAQVKSSIDYIWGSHEWRTQIKLVESFTRTSQIEEFVKTTDELGLKSTYIYLLERVPWLGPYGEFKFDTAIFEGNDVRSKATTYEIDQVDGTTRRIQNATKLRLSDPFAPLTLRETVGLFARPLQRDAITIEGKAGFGARQTFAELQRAVDDDDDTTTITEVKELEDFYQGGPSLGVGLYGAMVSGRFSYYLLWEAMFPVINSKADDDERSIGDLTNISFEGGFTFKIFDWASLVYQLKALREPQLVDQWQVQNNLLLSFSYTLVKSKADEQSASK